MPKVSVIIPVHNAEKYIKECIDSLLVQTLEDIEIICIDDASTDDSLQMITNFSQKDSRIKIYHHDVGKSALGARKTGVMAAEGDYIMFLDADDYYSADACETAYNKILEKNTDIVHFPMNIVNYGNGNEQKTEALKSFTAPYNGSLCGKQVFDYCFMEKKYTHTLYNKIYKAELCKKAYERTTDDFMIFAEDLYVYFAISDLAQSYYGYEGKSLYFYCYGRGVTQTDNVYTIEKFEKNCQHAKALNALKEYSCTYHAEDKKYKDIIKGYHDEWIIRSIRILDNYLKEEDKKKGEEIICRYWGKDDVCFMRDKHNYIKSRKSLITTTKFILNTISRKGFDYTAKVIKY